MKVFIPVILAGLLNLAVTPAAAQEGSAKDSTEEQASSEVMADADGTASAETEAEQPLDVMDQPLDGTSLEAFSAGLERLDQEASEAQYRQVMSALDYLLFYDIGARRDKAKLYAKLHGETPNQIIERVTSTRKNKN